MGLGPVCRKIDICEPLAKGRTEGKGNVADNTETFPWVSASFGLGIEWAKPSVFFKL